MTLAVADLPAGTRVVRERYYRDPDFAASYERELSVGGGRVGRSRLGAVFNDLNVEVTPADAGRLFAALRAALRTRAFRRDLGAEIADAAGIEPRAVAVARPRTPRIGDGAVSVAIRLRAQRVPFQAALTFLRVDRILSTIAVVGAPGRRLFARDIDRLTHASVERVRGGLLPRVSGETVVGGTPTPGATLSITGASWTGDQLAFAYQWERCVEPGLGCSPLPGATGSTYTVVENDLASSLRVVVTARNRLGSAAAASRSTTLVTGPAGAPAVLSGRGPAVEGVVALGATLTAATGEWTGSPTSFAFQWRRCNPATNACVDVAGATGETYALSPADSGSFLRVLVVASNAAGSGGALSAPSAPAP